jgi:hypothetical protein
MLPLQRIIARDRRKAAVHEAGHIVIGESLGHKLLFSYIQPTSTSDPRLEKTWIGQAVFYPIRLKKEREMVAVAGVVAECCWSGDTFDDIADFLESDGDAMSPSDFALANCEPGQPTRRLLATAEKVFALFEPRAGALAFLAQRLLRLIYGNRYRDKGKVRFIGFVHGNVKSFNLHHHVLMAIEGEPHDWSDYRIVRTLIGLDQVWRMQQLARWEKPVHIDWDWVKGNLYHSYASRFVQRQTGEWYVL